MGAFLKGKNAEQSTSSPRKKFIESVGWFIVKGLIPFYTLIITNET